MFFFNKKKVSGVLFSNFFLNFFDVRQFRWNSFAIEKSVRHAVQVCSVACVSLVAQHARAQRVDPAR